MTKKLTILILMALVCGLAFAPSIQAQDYDPFRDVLVAQWSRDGSRLVVLTQVGLTIYDTDFNVVSAQVFPRFSFAAVSPRQAVLSPDGLRLYVSGTRYEFRNEPDMRVAELDQYCATNPVPIVCTARMIVDSTTLQLQVDLSSVDIYPYSAEWSRDGQSIAFRRGDDHAAEIFSTIDGRLLSSLSSPPAVWQGGNDSFDLGWSSDNRYFVRPLGISGELFVLDAVSGQTFREVSLGDVSIDDIVWSPDNSQVLVKTSGARLPESEARSYSWSVIDIATGRVLASMRDPRLNTFNWLFSPDGTQIATPLSDGQVYIWDANTGNIIDRLPTPQWFRDMAYSPYGGRLMLLGVSAQGTDARNMPSSALDPDFMQSEVDGLVQILVPDPTPARLASIAAACNAPQSVTRALPAQATDAAVARFETALAALPEGAIPPACAADLQAVADALGAQP